MMRSNKGMSLVEVIVATGLLGIIAMGIASALSYYSKDFARHRSTVARDRNMNSLVSMLKIRISEMDITFAPNAILSKDVATFPYYWSADYDLMTKEECLTQVFKGATSCPLIGRMNYLIKPVPGVPSLYQASSYFYHPDINNGLVYEYTYFLSVK